MRIENEMEQWLDQLLQPQADCSGLSSYPPATEITLPLVPLKTWSFLASLNHSLIIMAQFGQPTAVWMAQTGQQGCLN